LYFYYAQSYWFDLLDEVYPPRWLYEERLKELEEEEERQRNLGSETAEADKDIDHWAVLGLQNRLREELTETDIGVAYKKAALRLHPDRNPDPEATQRFQRLSAAKDAALAELRTDEPSGTRTEAGEQEEGFEDVTGDVPEEDPAFEAEQEKDEAGKEWRKILDQLRKERKRVDKDLKEAAERHVRIQKVREAISIREGTIARARHKIMKEWSRKHGHKANPPKMPSWTTTPREEAEHALKDPFDPFPDSLHMAASAARTGSYLLLQFLLQSSDVTAGDDIGSGNNLLHFAAKMLDPQIITAVYASSNQVLLVDALRSRNEAGKTPLELAEASFADPAIRKEAIKRDRRARKEFLDLSGGEDEDKRDPGERVLEEFRKLESKLEEMDRANERVVDYWALSRELVMVGAAVALVRARRPGIAVFAALVATFIPELHAKTASVVALVSFPLFLYWRNK
jgi:hypothetical protein